ncbi:dihydropteroate synthase [Camelimonas abortus]|uniref:dihydropteroate synthase n=1 Tax=Camelimonas abortus TaxID=1017184 RepID=A0ABV7LGK7_9HYPH
MGVLNVTPDSFSDGGLYATPEAAAARACAIVAEGAHIIDVGGESTRPGHTPTPAQEEIARVAPAIRAARAALAARGYNPAISIDTWKARVAAAALEAGADIVNDIWGLQREPDIARVAAEHGAPVIIMHNAEKLEPEADVIELLQRFFDASLKIAMAAGVPEGKIVLDIGFGFGATRAQHLEAIRRLPELKACYGLPVLVGVSRKSTIGLITGRDVQDRLAGTIAGHVLALACGADIIRVHDVAAHLDAMRMVRAVMDPETALAEAEARQAATAGGGA